MKTILAAFLLLTSTCFGQAIASRRYAEKNILQYNFGPLVLQSPLNNQVNYTTIPTDNQWQPTKMVTDDNTFSSTANFTAANIGTGTPSFSVSANVGTVSSSGGTVRTTWSSSAGIAPAPIYSVQVSVNQNGTATSGGYDALEVGFCSGNNYITAGVDKPDSNALGETWIGGVGHVTNFASGWVPPAPPWRMGAMLKGNYLSFWYNTGSGWKLVGTPVNISSQYNTVIDGNFTGWKPCMLLSSSVAATSWKVSNLISGGAGGSIFAEANPVIYPDGRPYINGSTAYFTADFRIEGSNQGFQAIFSENMGTGELDQIATIADDRGGSLQLGQSAQLIYDPQNGFEYFIMPEYPSGGGYTNLFYWKLPIATVNLLTPGTYILNGAAATELSLLSTLNGNQGQDPVMVCTQWNYSAASCGKWVLSFTAWNTSNTYGIPSMQYTTGDPGANAWTFIGQDNPPSPFEGGKVVRTATGRGGVAYDFCFAGVVSISAGREPRQTRCYDQSMAYLGGITIPMPGGTAFPSHPATFAYGNNEYYLTFTDTGSANGGVNNSAGDWGLAAAPKYSGATNWPTFVNEGSAFSGSTSVSSVAVSTGVYTSTFTVSVGDLIVGDCRGGNNTETSAAVTDSLGNAFTNMALNITGSGFTDGFYGFATAAGTDTFTCTLGAAGQFAGLTVLQFHPGFLTAVDYTGYSNYTSSNVSVYTSSPFTTTAKGLVVVCADGLFPSANFQPGVIGPYGASYGAGLLSGAASCEGALTWAAQSGITASVGATQSGHWGGVIMSFK